MVMRPDVALKTVREIQAGPRAEEWTRLERIRNALSSDPSRSPSVELPKNPLPVMTKLAAKSKTNLLPLVLKTFSQVMRVDGFTPSFDDQGRAWSYWQRNRFDAQHMGLQRSAMAYGASYVTLSAGTNGPVWRPRSPLAMTALYQDPTVDEWPMLALDVDGPMLRLYDEEAVYFVGREPQPRSTYGYASSSWPLQQPADLTFIEARPHNFGAVPVVRFRDRVSLEGEEQFGIIEPLLTIQQRLDETVFGMLIAQFYAAFKQRYVIGWVPQSEQEALEANASSLWTFDDEQVKVGELSETDLTRYIEAKNSAKLDMAALAQVPAQALGQQGISNVSGAVMDGLETGKDREAAEMATSFGESYEQLFRGSAHLEGDERGATDFEAEIRWMNTVDMSLAQATDALTKWVQGLGVDPKIARGLLPNWTDQMERANASYTPPEADPLQTLLGRMNRQSGDVTPA